MNNRQNQRAIDEFKGEILNICGTVRDTYILREIHGLKHSRTLIYNLNKYEADFPDLIADCTADCKDIPLPSQRFSCVYFSGFPAFGRNVELETAISNALFWLKDDGILFYRGGNFNDVRDILQEKGFTAYEYVYASFPHIKKTIFIFKNNIPRCFSTLCNTIPGLRQVIADTFRNEGPAYLEKFKRISMQGIETTNKSAGDSSLNPDEIQRLPTNQNCDYKFKGTSPSLNELNTLTGIASSSYVSCMINFKLIAGIASTVGGALLLILGGVALLPILGGTLLVALGVGLFAHGRKQKQQHFSTEFDQDRRCPAFC